MHRIDVDVRNEDLNLVASTTPREDGTTWAKAVDLGKCRTAWEERTILFAVKKDDQG